MIRLFTALCLLMAFSPGGMAQRRTTPIIGWSSWNNFRIHIDETMIREQADAMINSGLADAGYEFINIDDGFFYNRNEKGKIQVHPEKFPQGMKHLANYIHSKGLKAGIYAEAGINTCAWQWDNDKYGAGAGSFGYEEQDSKMFLNEWGFDFLKVDYCGAKDMGLDEEKQYTRFSKAIRKVAPRAIYNVCRWEFPGTWVCDIADSWRISGDIGPNWGSISHIIDLNKFTVAYSGPGHFNDMDMLQVGRGMNYEEDKSHFSMWCMMNSPLLAGNDLRKMSKETISILSNEELIALNQDPAAVQARWVDTKNKCEIYIKPLGARYSNQVAVAVLNRSDKEKSCELNWQELGLKGEVKVRDLWEHKDLKGGKVDLNVTLPSHGIKVFKVVGEDFMIPKVFEAEYAFAKGFKKTTNIGRVKHDKSDDLVVQKIGRGDWLEWQDVYVPEAGKYTIRIISYHNGTAPCLISVNKGPEISQKVESQNNSRESIVECRVKLNKGLNSIRLNTKDSYLVNVDKLVVK